MAYGSGPSSRISSFTIYLSLVAASFSSLLTYAYLTRTCPVPLRKDTITSQTGLQYDNGLIGAPTTRFRENLRNQTKYITSWSGVGWTNDVMAYGNLLYLSKLTGRVAILPAFAPIHVGYHEPTIPFGDVFDVPLLSRALGQPIAEWRDVKDPANTEVEPLGCWSAWLAQHDHPRDNEPLVGASKLDVSYTVIPDWAAKNDLHNDHVEFWKLARLGFPEGRSAEVAEPRPSRTLGIALPPDAHLLCFDFLYYVAADEPFEYERDYSPAWRDVMVHARWTERLQHIADEYLRDMFDLAPGAPIPHYIVIHARHGDFRQYCYTPEHKGCFYSLPAWKFEIDAMRTALREQKGLDATHVVMTSDEEDPGWWSDVDALGWARVDHKRMHTVERFGKVGKWHEVFVDAVIQSGGVGFLGTRGSTMSLLAMRRTVDWHGGLGKLVSWE